MKLHLANLALSALLEFLQAYNTLFGIHIYHGIAENNIIFEQSSCHNFIVDLLPLAYSPCITVGLRDLNIDEPIWREILILHTLDAFQRSIIFAYFVHLDGKHFKCFLFSLKLTTFGLHIHQHNAQHNLSFCNEPLCTISSRICSPLSMAFMLPQAFNMQVKVSTLTITSKVFKTNKCFMTFSIPSKTINHGIPQGDILNQKLFNDLGRTTFCIHTDQNVGYIMVVLK